MRSSKNIGRSIGCLIVVQGVAGYVVNFVLLRPVMTGEFLVHAAGSGLQIRLAVLLGLANGALTVGIAIAAWPIFQRCSQALALWFLALAVVGFSLLVQENISILTMLSLSQEYAKPGAAQGVLQATAIAVRWSRHWAHYTNLLVAGGALLTLYGVLLRFALVARALAAFGVVAVALQILAVTMPILGYPIVFLLIAPLGVSQLMLALWLIFKGFADPPQRMAAAP